MKTIKADNGKDLFRGFMCCIFIAHKTEWLVVDFYIFAYVLIEKQI